VSLPLSTSPERFSVGVGQKSEVEGTPLHFALFSHSDRKAAPFKTTYTYKGLRIGRIRSLIMAALLSRCGHYIFVLRFLSFFFIPRLISAVADWMSAIHDVALVRI